jgi:colicin import membrane protein
MPKKGKVVEEETPKKKKKAEVVEEEAEVEVKKGKKKSKKSKEKTGKKKRGREKDPRTKVERIKARAGEEGFNKYGLREKSAGGVITNTLIKATERKKNRGATREELVEAFEEAGLSRAGTKVNPESAVDFWTATSQQREIGYTIHLDPETKRFTISDGAPSDKDIEDFRAARSVIRGVKAKARRADKAEKKAKAKAEKEAKAEADEGKSKRKKKGKKVKKSKKSSDE